jgi:hypothetical protein
MIFGGAANMPPKTRPASARLHPDRGDALRADGDRLPLYIAGPIIIALSLSL